MAESLYSRRKTHAVFVGQIGIGGKNPIRIQSMLTSDTKDTSSCLKEMQELINEGCEIIRLTIPTKTDLHNLKNIREEMKKQNLNVPLVADIHFTPSIALEAVDYVEKVRINPGNFIDKKLFKNREYSEDEYQSELKRLEEKFSPLVLKCKKNQVAMRIGTNHGSLSDRILNRYGDTPEGMVESALEFLRIAEKHNYFDIILSMKASNVKVMVTAYRLLAKRLEEENLRAYPFHLGVTEAGDGEDARIKSAMGIGTLLEEGIGDTIRVSLTEDSAREIPVAKAIAEPYNLKFTVQNFCKNDFATYKNKSFQSIYSRHESIAKDVNSLTFGKNEPPRVWLSYGSEGFDHASLSANSDPAFEGVEFLNQDISTEALNELKKQNKACGLLTNNLDFLEQDFILDKITFVVSKNISNKTFKTLIQHCHSNNSHLELCFDNTTSYFSEKTFTDILKKISFNDSFNMSFSLLTKHPKHDYSALVKCLNDLNCKLPIHLRFYESQSFLLLESSIQLGSLLIDGIGDSLQIMNTNASYEELLSLSYGILQASRVRMSKTEYIACPSCGRTLFNLQNVTAKIKERTNHLKGVKIGIMGCIVNGPGEMADADFGYVGTGTGKISLYVGQNCVKRNIAEELAVDSLINLIKEHGKWLEP